MRKSLIKSAEDSPVKGFERYAKGSIVLCHGCAKPIYVLDAGIALGDTFMSARADSIVTALS